MKVIVMNRKNGLEDFIWRNRSQFDSNSPRKSLWSRIESELDSGPPDGKEKPSRNKAYWIVLLAMAIGITAIGFYNLGKSKNASKVMLFAEVQSMEHHYNRQMIAIFF